MVAFNENTRKFEFNKKVSKYLDGYKNGNISFVAVSGMYRSGKSFLINRLLGL